MYNKKHFVFVLEIYSSLLKFFVKFLTYLSVNLTCDVI